MVLRPRGPSLWATAILTLLPGQTMKITYCIVFSAVGHLLLDRHERVCRGSRKGGGGRRSHGLSMPMVVPSSEGKYDEDGVSKPYSDRDFHHPEQYFSKGG